MEIDGTTYTKEELLAAIDSWLEEDNMVSASWPIGGTQLALVIIESEEDIYETLSDT
jgi:hemoglobin-like flavoprotein